MRGPFLLPLTGRSDTASLSGRAGWAAPTPCNCRTHPRQQRAAAVGGGCCPGHAAKAIAVRGMAAASRRGRARVAAPDRPAAVREPARARRRRLTRTPLPEELLVYPNVIVP